ncbi:MAG TPA: hypothetical protein VL966_17245 [Alphaproteobacteria bacterium]|jgi:hypothetical protein|nr:hypothetical protein [Alphaproteobacteria bacterium]
MNAPVKREAFIRNRRNRNIALAVVLIALVVLFYVLTWVKIAGGAA